MANGTWFFTVNLLQRRGNDLLMREINLFRQVVRRVKRAHPFHIDAWVVLLEHMAAGERGIWQRHFWEHAIRDDNDYRRHVDYVHVNPVKHGLVARVQDWPYSTFHRYTKMGGVSFGLVWRPWDGCWGWGLTCVRLRCANRTYEF